MTNLRILSRIPSALRGWLGAASLRISIAACMITSASLFIASIPVASHAAGARHAVSVTGWVSDKACGAEHTKPGGADCIRKCLRGGAAIGHPEWKPQEMVLVNDTGEIWLVENPSALSGNEGRHVRVNCHLNRKKNKLRVIAIESVLE